MVCAHCASARHCSHQFINQQRPPCNQSAVLNTRVEHPCAHVLGPSRRVQTENGAWSDHERLLERAGPRLVRDADV